MIPRVAADVTRKEITEILKALAKNSSELISDLEKSFRFQLGFKKSFFLNSGTAALYLALKSIGVEGREVIIPAYTCGAVVEAVLLADGIPVFVDVDASTFNISLEDLKRKLSDRTKVVIAVDLFGNPVDYYALREILESYDVYLIDDAAQALGAKYDNKYLGSFGDFAIFSFGLGKGVTGGGGGALIVNNNDILDKVEEFYSQLREPSSFENVKVLYRILSMFLFSRKKLYGFIRERVERLTVHEDQELVNRILKLFSGDSIVKDKRIKSFSKISKFSAAAVLGQIARLDCIVNRRRVHAKYLLSNLNFERIKVQECPKLGEHAYSRFGIVLKCSSRKTVRERMIIEGIDVEEMYSYMLKIYEYVNYMPPNATMLCKNILCLPIHGRLELEDLDFIAATFNRVIGSHKS